MDEQTLQEILPIPDQDELEQQILDDLKEDGFIITNYNNGGIFKTIIKIFLFVVYQLYDLLKAVIPNIFLHSAQELWVEVKAAENQVKRKQAIYTQGLVACSRVAVGNPVPINKGTIFKTEIDNQGNELRYIALQTVIMGNNELKAYVPVRAELEGQAYNVPAGSITKALQHIPGIDKIENEDGWIIKEGADVESIESLRERGLNIWNELSANPTGGKYESVVSKVEGVANVFVDDMHPRGQGTIDIILTGTAGAPTAELLEKVRLEVDKVKGPYDNISIFGPVIVSQDVDVTLYIDSTYGDEVKSHAEADTKIKELFKGAGNKLYKANIISTLMSIENAVNAKINLPLEDVELTNKEMLVPGVVSISIVKV